MKKVVVIGGGASGLISAIISAKKGCSVTILERNDRCGKKILMTGNGKCNYWNEDLNIQHYHTHHPEVLREIITQENERKVLEFFSQIGIVPRIKNGYYYPYSNQASSIKMALLKEAELNHVEIKYNCFIKEIKKEKEKFIIQSETEEMVFDSVIMATGSKACPKTGSDGKGYEILEKFQHHILPVLPALVQLKTTGKFLKDWEGIRCEGKISLIVDNKLVKQETGELQLTNYGISGICTFNISTLASIALYEEKKVSLSINFIPWISSKEELRQFLAKQNQKKNISEQLEGILNYKLIPILLATAHIKKEEFLDTINLDQLFSALTDFSLTVVGTQSFDQAQTTTGGVPLIEINSKTMESKFVKNLYLVGEILDVTGECGGYNLGFSWLSGMLAGIGVGEND